jgi:serine/threonine protein kinase/WD40 repeat protein
MAEREPEFGTSPDTPFPERGEPTSFHTSNPDETPVIAVGGHSVLQMVGQTLDSVPRVILRDPTEAGDSLVLSPAAEIPGQDSGSRYRLEGEIARGGMGVILKARDTDLGRELALKVLREAHQEKPEIIHRFIEEAQIGGQLQHPGIAPVYELGQFGDRRPFFTMKLVKGKTLAALLADREDPAEDRARFLDIFKQICQTMAYAHAHGVIHRDLKPANVMVGAFGEVQVMDWGLAKVLGQRQGGDETKANDTQKEVSDRETLHIRGSDPGLPQAQTEMGRVMGTLDYMPPEQALGQIDRLDQRSDVFGLGAILCEILTGKPVYVGKNRTALFQQATHGEMDDCLARLDRCGADSDLIDLAKGCRAREPGDRLSDAGVLTERISRYLESVDMRLREAEIERAAETARAEEERKRRRVTLALSASVLLAVVAGLAGLLVFALVVSEKNQQLMASNQDLVDANTAEREAKEAAQKAEANLEAAYYRSLVGEATSTRIARKAGFRVKAWGLLRQAASLGTPEVNLASLRQEAVNSLGDVVGNAPRFLKSSAQATAFTINADATLVFLGLQNGVIEARPASGKEPVQELKAARASAPVRDLGYASDANTLLAAHADGTIRYWQQKADGWAVTRSLKVDANPIQITATEGGAPVAVCLARRQISLWNLATGKKVAEINHLGVQNPRASPDGKYLAAARFDPGSRRYQMMVWEVASPAMPRRYEAGLGPVHCLAFSPDASYLGCACEEGFAVHNLQTNTREMFRRIGVQRKITFTNHLVAALAFHGTTRVIDLGSHETIHQFESEDTPLFTSEALVLGLEFSQDGSAITAATRASIQISSVTGTVERQLLSGHAGGVPGVAFSPDGTLLASVSKDPKLILWDTETGVVKQMREGIRGGAQGVVFHPNGRILATLDWGDGIRLWEVPSLKELPRPPVSPDFARGCIAFSPDGKYLASGGQRGLAVVGLRLSQEDGGQRCEYEAPIQLKTAAAASCLFDPGSALLAWSERSRRVHVWDFAHGSDRALPGTATSVMFLALTFGSDGRLRFTNPDGRVEAWDIRQLRKISTIGQAIPNSHGPFVVGESGGGRFLVVKQFQALSLREAANGSEVFQLPGEKNTVWCAAIRPDGRAVAVGLSDGQISLWRIDRVLSQLDAIGLGVDLKRGDEQVR